MKITILTVTWTLLANYSAASGILPIHLNSSDYINAVQRSAQILATKFRSIATNELGVSLFDVVAPISASGEPLPLSVSEEVEALLNSIADKLKTKLTSAINILHDMRNMVMNKTNTLSFTHPCPLSSIKKGAYSKISISANSIRAEPRLPIEEKAAPKWTGRFRDLKVKRQFFLSDADLATDEDCTTPHVAEHLRKIYHRTVHPDPKLVIFILNDAMNGKAIEIAISVMKEMLNVLQSTDKLMFRTTSGDFMKFYDVCGNSNIVSNVTDETKLLMHDHLLHVPVNTSTIEYESLHRQIRLQIKRLQDSQPILLIFLTDRNTPKIVSNLATSPLVEKDRKLFLSIGFIDETAFYTSNNTLKIHQERLSNDALLVDVYANTNIGQVGSALYSVLPSESVNTAESVSVGLPLWEPTQRDFVVPVLLRIDTGVLGVDLFWSDLSEDITYLKRSIAKRRAFVIDNSGTVLMHSFFPRPELSAEKIKFTSLEFVENYNFIQDVKQLLLSKFIGHFTVTVNNSTKLTYSWRKTRNLFTVCIVTEHGDTVNIGSMSDDFYSTHNTRDILYHRLDLFPPKNGNICRHFKQVATLDQGTVYLSPSSFQSPFSYLHDMNEGQDTALTYMQNYLAYLKGVAFMVLSNPGLKDEIRNNVNLLNSILSYFKRQHMQGPHTKYVVRRYAVAESGVLVMFPGTVLEYDYEPVRRPWYTSAVDNLGKIILSPPNLDVGGAGYVVSISYALQTKNYPFMVVSMDVTMGFLYKMLLDSFPHCSLSYVKCFIMNNRGYLISHPGLMDPNSSGPVEQQHITHMESLIAIDMLNHKGFVTKRECNNFSDRTIQRFYEFNTSLPGVLSKVVSGDHCVHYYIAAIPGTNAFIGVVNATCNLGAFCPCSMVDRLCLNCNRMEQNECECPCECSANNDQCPSEKNSSLSDASDVPMCGAVTENNHHKSHYFYNFAESLKPCFEMQCESYATHSSCLGVMGCEWCQLDTDGETALSSAFCTSQSTCFNGVLGAVTPYGEGRLGHATRDDAFVSYSAIGPVAGCLVTVCLIVAIAAYCYRQNVSGSRRQLYCEGGETWPDVRLGALADDAPDRSGRDELLPAPADPPVSPYRILTGSRRPRPAADSDHGYSTMTPHDDSEAMAFSLTEPIVMIDDADMSDVSCSVSTRLSKLRPRPVDTSVTVLPSGRHNVIAPVTVHRHMEAS